MKILAVDTALGACSAAVLSGQTILAHRLEAMQRGHAEALAPMVEDAIAASGLGFADLDRLAVTTGPGTFTGQRVGLAFMRGLRLALKCPLIGVTSLEAMAAQAASEANAQAAACLHDAKRGEVYALFQSKGVVVFGPALLPFEEAVARVAQESREDGAFALAGTASSAAASQLPAARTTSVSHPDALWVARLALRAPVPAEVPRPLYLRPADAKLPP